MKRPDVATRSCSTFGGGWAWPLTKAGREALFVYFDEDPAPLMPLDGTEGYIVEPHDAESLAEHLRNCDVTWEAR